MNIKRLLVFIASLGALSLSGQEWSVGLDLISFGRFIDNEQTPAILQIQRSFNDRHALRSNLGIYQSHKYREWDYFNSGNGVSVLREVFDEVNFQYSIGVGWQYSVLNKDNSFRLYLHPGVLFEYFKSKRTHKIKEGRSIPTAGIPREEVFIYPRQEYDNHKLNLGVFLIPGVEVKISEHLSFSLESEVRGFFYKEIRYEQEFYWNFDWSLPSPPNFFAGDGHYYDEKGFELKSNAIQYLFIRYTF